MVDFAELDVIAGEYWRPDGQPGLAFGVVRDGELVHWGGFGQRFLGGPAPDADTVFRISSMKGVTSFWCAAGYRSASFWIAARSPGVGSP